MKTSTKRDYETEYKQIVSECAELARSLSNRRAMMGLYDPLHIYIINHRLVPLAGQDVERAWSDNLPLVGTIGPDLPYDFYWIKIYDMAYSAPLFA